MEIQEERENREFDELNEGLIAMQIMEWFERTNPQPYLHPNHPPEPGSDLDEEWNTWALKLGHYAAGWKDALKALQERQQLEKAIELSDGAIGYQLRNHQEPVQMLISRHKFNDEHLWREEIVVLDTLGYSIEDEDWDYREPR